MGYVTNRDRNINQLRSSMHPSSAGWLSKSLFWFNFSEYPDQRLFG